MSDEFYIQDTPKDASKSRNRSFHWQEVNKLVIGNIELDGEEKGETKHIRTDEYWNKEHCLYLFFILFT